MKKKYKKYLKINSMNYKIKEILKIQYQNVLTSKENLQYNVIN